MIGARFMCIISPRRVMSEVYDQKSARPRKHYTIKCTCGTGHIIWVVD